MTDVAKVGAVRAADMGTGRAWINDSYTGAWRATGWLRHTRDGWFWTFETEHLGWRMPSRSSAKDMAEAYIAATTHA